MKRPSYKHLWQVQQRQSVALGRHVAVLSHALAEAERALAVFGCQVARTLRPNAKSYRLKAHRKYALETFLDANQRFTVDVEEKRMGYRAVSWQGKPVMEKK